MSTPMQTDRNRAGSSNGPPATAEGEFDPVKLLLRVHGALRGRYWLAILMAVVLGGGGGLAAWSLIPPTFRAVGSVHISAYAPRILYSTESKGLMPRYENYLNIQAARMRSSRLIEMAMNTEVWQSTGQPFTVSARDEFSGSLGVWASPEQETVNISFIDEDGEVAEKAVQSVIEAYTRIHNEETRQQDLSIIRVLEERQRSLSNQLEQTQSQIEQITSTTMGKRGLQQRYFNGLQELKDIRDRLEELNLQLKQVQAGRAERSGAVDQSGPANSTGLTVAAGEENPLYANDGVLADLVNRRQSAVINRELLEARLGANHFSVRRQDSEIERIDRQIEFRKMQLDGRMGEGDIETRIKDEIARFEESRNAIQAELADLLDITSRVGELEDSARLIRERLTETRRRIEQLNLESVNDSRMRVISEGELQRQPANAGSRFSRTAMVSAGGASVGFLLVAGICVLTQRVRRLDDVPEGISALGLLGMMPELTGGPRQHEQIADARWAADHIRVKLQLWLASRGTATLTVTSAASGSGKTSITMALAQSYARSGTRTLVIDFDLEAGSLTRRLHRSDQSRLGALLSRSDGVDPETLNMALARRTNGQMTGQWLVQEGLVTAESVDRALRWQAHLRAGVCAAVDGVDLDSCCTPTQTPNLFLLPVGEGQALARQGRIGPQAVDQILQAAKARYEVVIIDVGPMPGTVESTLVASLSDAVLLVLSRGEACRDVSRSIRYLRSTGARSIGHVYNRASEADLRASSHEFSASASRRQRSTLDTGDEADLFTRSIGSPDTAASPAQADRQAVHAAAAGDAGPQGREGASHS